MQGRAQIRMPFFPRGERQRTLGNYAELSGQFFDERHRSRRIILGNMASDVGKVPPRLVGNAVFHAASS
jgi:hypothetical protein